MNIKEIKEMINLMNDNNLMELEVEKEGMRIKLRRSASGEIEGAPFVIEKTAAPAPATAAAPAPAESTPTAQAQTKTIEIKSPMVGTFYQSPSPEAGPYAEVGQTVEPGQVICIIEAMKLMNEIKAEVKGKVKEILVENADPVEFGQPLFIVEPV